MSLGGGGVFLSLLKLGVDSEMFVLFCKENDIEFSRDWTEMTIYGC